MLAAQLQAQDAGFIDPQVEDTVGTDWAGFLILIPAAVASLRKSLRTGDNVGTVSLAVLIELK